MRQPFSPMNLLDQIDHWGRIAPGRIAHRSAGGELSYGELLRLSDALASRLESDLGSDRRPIAVHGHKEPGMLVAFLGIVKSGRPYVPIDSGLPSLRVMRILEGAGASRVLTPDAVLPLCTGENRPLPRMGPSDPFYILFTSGSTGQPKGVTITLANLQHFTGWLQGEHLFAPGEGFLNQAPFSFDLSVMDLYGSLASGGTLVSITREEVANGKLLYAALASSEIVNWVSTPSFVQMCLVERTFAQGMLPHLRRFLFCGETLAPETAAQLLERFPKAEVWNTYGPTEATVATTSIRVDDTVLAAHPVLPVGAAMPGTQLFIRGEDGARMPEGERGEIIIAGPNVSPGYLGRPDLTERAFFEHEGHRAYRTGDWGRERAGLFFFEGRMDDQVKVNGYRIELGDLEANLRALPEIADAVVLPVEKSGRTDSLVAFVVLAGKRVESQSDFQLTAALKTRLGERVPAYMVPRKFFYLEAFPMTPNGKADRRALADRLMGKV